MDEKRHESNVFFNFIYNSAFQILKIVLPLITIPYVTRVLGADNLGIYSFTNSYAVYFAMFAHLGFEHYGNRLIAQHRDNQDDLNRAFSGAYSLQIISSLTAIVAYIFYMLIFCKDNILIAWIQLLFIISELFNVAWIYHGLEHFKKTVFISFIVRIISFACIFAFVKHENDLPIYTVICTGSSFFSAFLMWISLRHQVRFVKVSTKEIISHAKGCIILFFPVLVISIYRTMDKIMLGHMSTMSEVAIYSYADKIVEMPYGIIAALGVVMLPRMSNYVAHGEKTLSNKYIEASMRFMLFMACAMSFGMMGVGKVFAPIFFGKDFEACGVLMMVIAPMVIIRACANVVRTQYLLPNKRDRDYIISILIGVVINLILNSIFIPRLASKGAAMATLFAESFVAIYQIFACRKEIPVVKYTFRNWFFLIAGLIMFLVVYTLGITLKASIKTLVLQIIVGIVVYAMIGGGYYYYHEKQLIQQLIKNRLH